MSGRNTSDGFHEVAELLSIFDGLVICYNQIQQDVIDVYQTHYKYYREAPRKL